MINNSPWNTTRAVCVWCLILLAAPATPAQENSWKRTIRQVQSKVVKVYGAGGLRGLEAHQSGLLLTPTGHVLTVWSYVLDTDEVTVVLDDGRRFVARLLGADPLTEIAVLELEADEESLPHFAWQRTGVADVGTRVLAFSNLFGIATGNEPVSVLHGSVSGVAPLAARRGAYSTRFEGDVYVVDAQTNNPGAAGGALTDIDGNLLGMLGKEVRSQLTNTWLNYALPINSLAPVVEDILTGRFEPPAVDALDRPEQPLDAIQLGLVLVPDVVARTPPFVDRVLPNSPAEAAGLQADDLVVMVDGQITNSCRDVAELLGRYESGTAVTITVLRSTSLLEFNLP